LGDSPRKKTRSSNLKGGGCTTGEKGKTRDQGRVWVSFLKDSQKQQGAGARNDVSLFGNKKQRGSQGGGEREIGVMGFGKVLSRGATPWGEDRLGAGDGQT